MRMGIVLLALLLLPPGLAAAADTTEYRLGAGDLVKINVFGYPDMAADVRIDELGNLRYALIGAVTAAAHTTSEVESLIAQRLSDGGFIRSAQVSVLVTEYRSQKVSVMGQVNRPGRYPLTQRSTVSDLLADAGGAITGIAADEAILLRTDGTKLSIDLNQLFKGDAALNATVNAGDTLYVPRAAQFYIYGEVQRPGVYRLERDMTISQAISAGGGLTPRGTERHVTIKRREADGHETHLTARTSDLMRPDDVLLVKERLF